MSRMIMRSRSASRRWIEWCAFCAMNVSSPVNASQTRCSAPFHRAASSEESPVTMRNGEPIVTRDGRECYHCKQWIGRDEAHDCWTTTEAALTRDLPDNLREAWERLRETAVEFGDQRIYASHQSIMFSRGSCYFFVRPKKQSLEVCVFLGRM